MEELNEMELLFNSVQSKDIFGLVSLAICFWNKKYSMLRNIWKLETNMLSHEDLNSFQDQIEYIIAENHSQYFTKQLNELKLSLNSPCYKNLYEMIIKLFSTLSKTKELYDSERTPLNYLSWDNTGEKENLLNLTNQFPQFNFKKQLDSLKDNYNLLQSQVLKIVKSDTTALNSIPSINNDFIPITYLTNRVETILSIAKKFNVNVENIKIYGHTSNDLTAEYSVSESTLLIIFVPVVNHQCYVHKVEKSTSILFKSIQDFKRQISILDEHICNEKRNLASTLSINNNLSIKIASQASKIKQQSISQEALSVFEKAGRALTSILFDLRNFNWNNIIIKLIDLITNCLLELLVINTMFCTICPDIDTPEHTNGNKAELTNYVFQKQILSQKELKIATSTQELNQKTP